MLHPDDVAYFAGLVKIGESAAAAFGVRLALIEPKRRPSTGTLGLAYLADLRISIAVRGKDSADMGGAWWKRRYTHDENLRTLAHELAHLLEHQRHGKTNHGARFREYERELLSYITRAA